MSLMFNSRGVAIVSTISGRERVSDVLVLLRSSLDGGCVA